MPSQNSHTKEHKTADSFVHDTLNGVKKSGFTRTLHRDLKDLYYFYLDTESRKRLAGMSRFQRWLRQVFWILKSMFYKLAPVRRVLLIVALVLMLGTSDNIRFLSFLGLLLILMLELKDKLLAKDELEVGRAVQFSLLPQDNPQIPGWDIWLFTQPANEVGGDLVDYLKISENRWGIALGDVAGKGLGAALFMAKLQASLRALAPIFDSLEKFGVELNHIFRRDGVPDRFVSLIYLEVCPNSNKIRLLNAGHIPPLISKNGKIHELEHGTTALGIMEKASFKEQQIDLKKGDMLLVYTDGITEARNEKGEFFGEERLRALIPTSEKYSSEKFGNYILSHVEKFVGEAPANDDLSLLILKRIE